MAFIQLRSGGGMPSMCWPRCWREYHENPEQYHMNAGNKRGRADANDVKEDDENMMA
jgi:hypothetical protein